MSKRFTITDARGKTVELSQASDPEQVLKQLSPIERKQFSDILWPDDPRSSIRAVLRLFLTIAVVVLVLVLLGILLTTVFPDSMSRGITFVMVFVPTFAVTVMLIYWRRRSLQQRPVFTKAMLKVNRCPACVYSLAGLAGESDGCVVCPECGAAWPQADKTD